ncbi:MAG: hypothetical protein QXS20_08275 [Candidatus Thorarchaeota archaeon]
MADICESCGKEMEPFGRARTLEETFLDEQRRRLSICVECFNKRFKIVARKSGGYGGTVYSLEEKPPPRFGVGSQRFSCLKCEWVAWTEQGLAEHMRKRHPK